MRMMTTTLKYYASFWGSYYDRVILVLNEKNKIFTLEPFWILLSIISSVLPHL